jgi:uncharacterized protein (DUF2164 family)
MVLLELSKQSRADAVASMRRYFDMNMPEPLGNLPAEMLLNFFLEEIGPAIYNKAIADAQGRIQQRVLDLSGDLFADEFPYWPKVEAKKRR